MFRLHLFNVMIRVAVVRVVRVVWVVRVIVTRVVRFQNRSLSSNYKVVPLTHSVTNALWRKPLRNLKLRILPK